MGRFMNFRKLVFKSRQGVTLVECLLMIVVVALTVGAILQTSAATTRMQVAGRGYVDSHKAALSFLNIVESIDPTKIIDGTEDPLNNVRNALGITTGGKFSGNMGYIAEPPTITPEVDGVITMSITIHDNENSRKTIIKNFNAFNYRPVSDDREITGP